MKLTSPNYPHGFDPLENCTWTIEAPQGYYVTLDFEAIDVSNKEFCYTYLIVGMGQIHFLVLGNKIWLESSSSLVSFLF